ncbi:uncharacterized protein LOC122951891 [Acropora millepora]|uniref:uncharacterized protein LOC122951891 n=1 Tax=Acropora millepora TaxID=45264 RepID=UPI001CF5F0D6|nr:uncharacterized protein LOC122951891 [Acropora millepora]
MREEELLEVKSTIEQARLRVQILEEAQSEEYFDLSHGLPRATSDPEIKSYDQRTEVYPNVEPGSTPDMKRTMPSRPSRDYTYMCAELDPAMSRHVDTQPDLDPAMSRHIHVPRMGSDTLRGHRDLDCVTPKLEREPTYGQLGTDIDAGYSPYQGNLEQLLHQQQ